ncbi:efflux transporter periplasmic adaptor subunit [Arachidicoccus ginsenosidimutans]|uniref:efflux RND transporter periplasmic adaptor subunit n=1 Tax=Arachidicoccus sp. BS20 TaxID=1850526 RepID=UPI0007F120CF|nr:efflux RND transporter periplasmic adaptor subunit [Arachidicoccus sp. BS20]ANI89719.1 efflux transporter periplasmic adaptor subunit [Arachidicoccus sp. BS20]
MRHTAQLIIAATLAVFVSSCKQKTEEKTIPDEVIPVSVVALQQQSLQQTVYTSGQFTTDDESNLAFKNGGIIHKIYVKEGDAVTKGQLLATLDLTEINTVARQAAIALQKAQRDYDRAVNLYRDSVATLEQMQNAKTALDIAKQQSVSANYNQSTSELRATQSGYVLQKFVNEGQVVGAGTPVLQINGAANSDWILKVGVSDNQWANIAIGDKATVTTDALPNKTFSAIVYKKSEGIDPASGTFVLQLKLMGDDKKGIASGLFGKAEITPAKAVHAWSIPMEALLDGDKNEGYVFVTNDEQHAEKIKVDIQRIDNDRVIVSAGLENVQYLIVGGNAYLTDGSKIKVLK